MKVFQKKIQHDGQKNAVLQVSGFLDSDVTQARTILTLEDLQLNPKAIRIESIVYAFQDKMGCVLWWQGDENIYPILPLEGRGTLNFNDMQGLHSPQSDVKGIAITTYGVDKGKYFLITLDLTKQ